MARGDRGRLYFPFVPHQEPGGGGTDGEDLPGLPALSTGERCADSSHLLIIRPPGDRVTDWDSPPWLAECGTTSHICRVTVPTRRRVAWLCASPSWSPTGTSSNLRSAP